MTLEQQQLLLAYLGYYNLRRKDGSLAIDGAYGPAMAQAIRDFQKDFGLNVDGDCGPQTQKALRHSVAYGVPEENKSSPTPNIPSWWSKYPAVPRESWRCQCKGRYCNGFPVEPHEATVAIVQKCADHFHGQIVRHSGIRCERWNADPSVGGASGSKHIQGMAYDFHIPGVSPQQLYDYIDRELIPGTGGLGIYNWGVHVDDRPVKGRWRG